MRFLRAWAFAWLVAAAFSALLSQGITAGGDELLVNGGFEQGTDRWTPSGGELTTSEPGEGRDGSTAGVFTAQDTPKQIHRVSQCVPACEGGEYEFTAYLARPSAGPPTISVRLNTVWYDADGCSGDQLDERDLGSLVLGEEEAGAWKEFRSSFPGAPRSRSAHLEVFVDFAANGEAVLHLDDFSFRGPPAPSLTPTPTPTPTLTPTPTPEPTASPAPSPSSTPQPTATTTPPRPIGPPSPSTGGGTPPPPIVYGLVNGGFEETDGEGRLLGWRKYGGEVTRSAYARMEGRFSAEFSSRTQSTKWVFQTVRVEGGKAYELSGYALKNDPDVEAAYLRLSWYASGDGSGQAIDQVDSTTRLTEDSPDFRLLTTAAVVAPAEASSAKVRLMLDPAGRPEAIVYFDAISFGKTAMPPPSPDDSPTPTVVPGDEGSPSPTPVPSEESPPSPAASPPTPSPFFQSGGQATPAPFALSPSSPPSLHTTPSTTTADGGRTLAGRERQVSIDSQLLRDSLERTPAALYRERRASAAIEAAPEDGADSGASAARPVVVGLAGLAVALGLSGGLYLWQRRRKTVHPTG